MFNFIEHLNEAAKVVKEQYKGDSLTTAIAIKEMFPNPHDFNTLYYNEKGSNFFFETERGWIKSVSVRIGILNIKKVIGYGIGTLTTRNTFKENDEFLWSVDISDFYSVFKDQSKAQKFLDECNKKIKNKHIDDVHDICQKIYEKYKK